jgi:hypothetical protein
MEGKNGKRHLLEENHHAEQKKLRPWPKRFRIVPELLVL